MYRPDVIEVVVEVKIEVVGGGKGIVVVSEAVVVVVDSILVVVVSIVVVVLVIKIVVVVELSPTSSSNSTASKPIREELQTHRL
jgi:hypothetical protein